MKVLDFGISKIRADANFAISSPALTGSHTIMGSPAYMAPEQMRASRDVDGRTDIWAIGTILYELIAGSSAFTGDTLAVVCSAVLNDAPLPLQALRPNLAPGLEEVVLRCLDKQPSRRYSNVPELVRDLVRFAPEQSRDALGRIRRLVGDLAPEHLQVIDAARAAGEADPFAQSDDRAMPPTLSMLYQPSSAAASRIPDAAISINLNSTRTAPGTGVVWSGTGLGLTAKPKSGRSLLIGMTALIALAAAMFVVFRLRGAGIIKSAPAAAVESAGHSTGPVALGAPIVNGAPSPPALSVQPTTNVSSATGINSPVGAPVLDGKKRSIESKIIEPPSGRPTSNSFPSAASANLPQAEVSTKVSEPIATKPEPPKQEPAAGAPVRSSRVTDYGGRE